MADRRWTVMVVPHGSDSPRSFSVSERTVRASMYTGAALALIALIGLGSAVASTGRYISHAVRPTEANAMGTRPRDMGEVARRVASLRDTLDVIRKREAQIRLLAGLPAADSGSQAPVLTSRLTSVVSASTMSASRSPAANAISAMPVKAAP